MPIPTLSHEARGNGKASGGRGSFFLGGGAGEGGNEGRFFCAWECTRGGAKASRDLIKEVEELEEWEEWEEVVEVKLPPRETRSVYARGQQRNVEKTSCGKVEDGDRNLGLLARMACPGQ